MDQLAPVIFVVILIAFILIKQIKHVTDKIDSKSENSGFSKYSNFSAQIQTHIRKIKMDIDSSKEGENTIFILKTDIDEKSSIEELSNFIRKLVFFETLLAKDKKSNEIESELFQILSKLDTFIKTKCEDGENLANRLRDDLQGEFQNI